MPTEGPTRVRCSQQYHQEYTQWHSESIGFNLDAWYGGAFDGSGWSGDFESYGTGLFIAVTVMNLYSARRGSQHKE